MLYKLRWAQKMQPVLGGRPDFDALINPKTAQDKERVRILTEVYKMDPKLIKEVDEEYGPLDWRLPDAHAIYWAELGREQSRGNPKDQETLRRSIYQSMQAAAIRGGALDRSVTNVTERNFMLWPNLDLVGKVSATYEELLSEENRETFQVNIQTAHKNFLKQAIYLLFEDNRRKEAAYWFNYLKTTYTNAFVLRQANISLEDFALGQIVEDNGETDMNKVNGSIYAMFDDGFECLVRDDDERYVEYENMAKLIWTHYHEKIGEISKQRLSLPPLADMRKRILDLDLDPDPARARMSRQEQAILRTKLNLPAPKPAASPSPAEQTATPASPE
jgi:hypothetical protein